MKLEDLTFSDEGRKRIFAEATRLQTEEESKENRISYAQLVQIAKDSQIDEKYIRAALNTGKKKCDTCGEEYSNNIKFCARDGSTLFSYLTP